MIEKIITILNIGKFENYNAKGDVSFGKFTAVFSGNGYGKSTLADVLRSLSSNDCDIISGRKTLGKNDNELVRIKLSERTVEFSEKKWSGAYPNISIYDSSFINENVYGGNVVDHKQKRNLFRIIIGKKGVDLAKELDELDSKGRNIQSELKELNSTFSIETGVKEIEAFASQSPPEDISEKSEKLIRDRDSATAADNLKNKSVPELIELSDFSIGTLDVLPNTVENVADDAERLLQDHLKKFNGCIDAKWLSNGINLNHSEDCPFCGQDLSGIDLINAYKLLFGVEYKKLKNKVDSNHNKVSEFSFTKEKLKLAKNSELLDYWRQFIDFEIIEIDEKDIEEAIVNLKKSILSMLSKKRKNLLESIEVDHDFFRLKEAFDTKLSIVNDYNLKLAIVREEISEHKAKATNFNIAEIEKSILELKTWSKIEKESNLSNLMSKYITLKNEKKNNDSIKKTKRKELDEYTEKIFPVYQDKINEYLENFDTGFKLIQTQGSFKGGKPSSDYQLLIKGTAFDIGNADSPAKVPSFKNTLSSGDKSTLSLAFFMASLDMDSNASDRIVVFDDPFTSQDRFRKSYTRELIVNETKRSKQVILLSHDDDFLEHVWEKRDPSNSKSLQIIRLKGSSALSEWDIDSESRSVPNLDHDLLVNFVRDGHEDLLKVVRAIRPWIEAWIRQRFTGCFSNSDSLGHMLGKIKESFESEKLFDLKSSYDDLSEINDFATTYQHGEDTKPQNIDAGELTSYVKRALRFTGSI